MKYLLSLTLFTVAIFLGVKTSQSPADRQLNQDVVGVLNVLNEDDINSGDIKNDPSLSEILKSLVTVENGPADFHSDYSNIDIAPYLDLDKKSHLFIAQARYYELHHRQEQFSQKMVKLKEYMQHSPEQAFYEISTLIRGISYHQHPLEMAAFFSLLSHHVGPQMPRELLSFSLEVIESFSKSARPNPEEATTQEEMKLAYSTTEDMFLPILAIESAFKYANDYQQTFQLSLEALRAQGDYGVQMHVVQLFAKKHPDHLADLISQVEMAGIEMNIPSGYLATYFE